MNAAQNARRWSVKQRREARTAMAEQLEHERAEKLAGMRASLAALEASNEPLARQLAAAVREQIASLTQISVHERHNE